MQLTNFFLKENTLSSHYNDMVFFVCCKDVNLNKHMPTFLFFNT